MKKRITPCTIAVCTMLLFINVKAIAQKNYGSIESGYFFGGPSNQIAEALKKNGFADRDYADLWIITFVTEYPRIKNYKIGHRLRYGRQINNNKTIEINLALVHKSEITGHDDNTTNEYFINFNSQVIALSATYMLTTKHKTAGFGAGPSLGFYKLDISSSPSSDAYSTKHTHIQPGITLTGFWRFVNKPVYFMDLRSDLLWLAPVNTSAVSTKENSVVFPSVKVNSFCGSITVSAGIKF